MVNAALLRPLPYPDGARLMVVWDRLSKLGIAQFPVSYANYLDYKTGNRVFEDVAAFSSAEFNLTTAEQAERVPGVYVSANLLAVLGVAPAAGRVFLPEENGAGRDNVVVLSDSLWRRRFGGDPNVLGKTIILDGNALQIMGILPRAFSFAALNPPPEVCNLAVLPGITVTGTVPDVRPYLTAADVAVIPLRIGSGTRLKILEALAMHKAIVSTSLGAEGLDIISGEHLLIEDQPAAFAQAVVDLLRDPERRQLLGKKGRELVAEEYSWQRCGDRLLHILEQVG